MSKLNTKKLDATALTKEELKTFKSLCKKINKRLQTFYDLSKYFSLKKEPHVKVR